MKPFSKKSLPNQKLLFEKPNTQPQNPAILPEHILPTMKKWQPTKLCQLVGLFLVHVRLCNSSHLRGVVKLLLPLLPPHDLAKDPGLQNRHLPALATLKPEPFLNHLGVLPSMNPLPRSGHIWRLPPDQYWHGNPVLSWMACLSLLMLAFEYGRREKGVALLKA